MTGKVFVNREDDYASVFSNVEIRQGETILVFTDVEFIHSPSRFSLQVDVDLHIDVKQEKLAANPDSYLWRYLNHSCNPNCYFEPGTLSLIALKDIPQNEELTINYLFTEAEMAHPFVCSCGETGCYGEIRGFNFHKNKEVLRELPYLANHLKQLKKMQVMH